MNELNFRIIKLNNHKHKITSETTIELFDFDDICNELEKMEKSKIIKSLEINPELIQFRMTFWGWCCFISAVIKRFINYTYALIVLLIITAFLYSSFPAYQNLINSWNMHDEPSMTFYAAQIGFYLTIVVVIISFITMLTTSRSKTDEMLFKVQQEVKKIRKQSGDVILNKHLNIEDNIKYMNMTLQQINVNLLKLIEISSRIPVTTQKGNSKSKK